MVTSTIEECQEIDSVRSGGGWGPHVQPVNCSNSSSIDKPPAEEYTHIPYLE